MRKDTKLIQLKDNTLIEVEVDEDSVAQISGGFSGKVDSTLKMIKPLLVNACTPIASAWKELNKDLSIDEVTVELGLSFEGEGNLYITKSKSGANLAITLTLKPEKK